MSLNGLETLRMGYVSPKPPPPLPLVPDGKRDAITCDAAFDAWVMLPVEDLRTLQEHAENPVPLVRRLPIPPPAPPQKKEVHQVMEIGEHAYAFYLETGTISSSHIGSDKSRGPLGID